MEGREQAQIAIDMNHPVGVDDEESQSPAPIKLTLYRLLNTTLISAFGLSKAILAYKGESIAPTTLELIIIVVLGNALWWLGYCETVKLPIWPWLFRNDYSFPALQAFCRSTRDIFVSVFHACFRRREKQYLPSNETGLEMNALASGVHTLGTGSLLVRSLRNRMIRGDQLVPSRLILDTPYGEDMTGQVTILLSPDAPYRWKIGTGAAADVFKGERQPQGTLVAVKIFRATQTDNPTRIRDINRRLVRESYVWLGLNHPHIQPYLGYCTNLGLVEALISPFCGGGTMREYLRHHVSADRQRFVKQVAQGLSYLHANDIIHGDLHAKNVLVDDSDNARLCDFGRGKVIGEVEYNTALFAGFAPYMAPELFPDDERIVDQQFSPSSDVYAFGMLAFEMFTDEVPFSSFGALSQFRIMSLVRKGDRPLRSSDTQERISDGMWEIIRHCWVANPDVRPSAGVIVERIGKLPAPFEL